MLEKMSTIDIENYRRNVKLLAEDVSRERF